MTTITIHLKENTDGALCVRAEHADAHWEHRPAEEGRAIVQNNVSRLMDRFEDRARPLVDPVALQGLGQLLRDVYLKPFYGDLLDIMGDSQGQLLLSSTLPDSLNLPWELLPAGDGSFLATDARWAIRRTTRAALDSDGLGLLPPPLRILFVACAPTNLAGLDYEREEEAILRLTERVGAKVYLEIAESGTFDELRDLISEVRPHVVHLSGHGVVAEGVGWFAFEDDRGSSDNREASEMASRLFAGSGVQLAFISGCQTSRAAAAGVCQCLIWEGHVPVVIGWGASIADDWATDFAREFFHEIAAGVGIDRAVSAARQELFHSGRHKRSGVELLDVSFALLTSS